MVKRGVFALGSAEGWLDKRVFIFTLALTILFEMTSLGLTQQDIILPLTDEVKEKALKASFLQKTDPIEIFMDGKKYKSFEEYRLETSHQASSNTAHKVKDNPQAQLESLKDMPEERGSGLLIADPEPKDGTITAQGLSKINDANASDLDQQMREMLEKFYLKHQNEPPMEIESGKVKTIEITPSSK